MTGRRHTDVPVAFPVFFQLQELASLLVINSELVDWRKFLLVAALPWPIPLEEELLETLQRFKAVDEEQLGTVTFEQYLQVTTSTRRHTSYQCTCDLSHVLLPDVTRPALMVPV